MRTFFLALALALLSTVASAQDPWSDEVTAVVRVTEVEPAPLCGRLHVAVLVRMEIVSVTSGTVGRGPVYAYWDCGQIATPGVGTYEARVGGRYRIELQRRAPQSFGGVSAVPPSGHTIYFAVRGEEIPIGGS